MNLPPVPDEDDARRADAFFDAFKDLLREVKDPAFVAALFVPSMFLEVLTRIPDEEGQKRFFQYADIFITRLARHHQRPDFLVAINAVAGRLVQTTADELQRLSNQS